MCEHAPPRARPRRAAREQAARSSNWIAESRAEIDAARLMILTPPGRSTARARAARVEISTIKFYVAGVHAARARPGDPGARRARRDRRHAPLASGTATSAPRASTTARRGAQEPGGAAHPAELRAPARAEVTRMSVRRSRTSPARRCAPARSSTARPSRRSWRASCPASPADPAEVAQFPGGASNLTYLVRAGERSEWVLRRPPVRHQGAQRARHGARVPHPVAHPRRLPLRPARCCSAPTGSVLGEEFYLMERLRG
jgi:hypothetical protein